MACDIMPRNKPGEGEGWHRLQSLRDSLGIRQAVGSNSLSRLFFLGFIFLLFSFFFSF